MGQRWSRMRLAGALCLLAGHASSASASHHRHGAPRSASSEAQKALDRAKEARAALARQQATQRKLVAERQQAARIARKRAQTDAVRTQHYSALTAEAAAALEATRQQIEALEADIAARTRQRQAIEEDIARHENLLRAMLPLAERMALHPGASLIAAPMAPDHAVQGLAIVAGISTLTERTAEALRAEKQELVEAETALEKRNTQLASLEATQTAQRNASQRQTRIAERVQARAESAADQARAAVNAATAQAADLQDAIVRIQRAQAEAQARLDAEARELQRQHQMGRARQLRAQARALSQPAGRGVSHGSGHAPVAGSLVTNWGQDGEGGPATGLTYAASAGASVAAPCAGRVDFAGPFRSFGQMVILDCGRNYRFVLAGFGTVSAGSGTAVGKGGTLGAMPSGGGRLFVQLRNGSRAIDPRPFL